MRKTSKLITILLSICLLTTLFAGSAWANSWKHEQGRSKGWEKQQLNQMVFMDVENHWARNDIEKLQLNGIMKGYENRQFQPERPVSKNEAIAIIMRVVDSEVVSSDKADTIKQIFPGWMGLAPVQAYDAGILADWELARWNGNNPATRIEVAMWLSRASKDKNISVKEVLSFARDVKQLSKDELVFAAIMYNKGIMKGSANGNLNPYKPISRGEFAVMISRFINSENLDDEDYSVETPDLIKGLYPANQSKIDPDTRQFEIKFTDNMNFTSGKDMEDLPGAVQILKYRNGSWVDANLEFALVFTENDDELVVKLDSNESLAGSTKYCITFDDAILETEDSEFEGISKGEWTFTTEDSELTLEKATAPSATSVVLQFNRTIQKGDDFSAGGTGIHVMYGEKELDVDAATISNNKLTITLDNDDSLEDGRKYEVWLSDYIIDNFEMNEADALTFEYQD